MKLLVIDTALGACTVGVFEDDRSLAVRQVLMIKGHSERLGGLVRDAVAEAAVGFGELDRIGVTVGPGSFTGLRVGLAFAQGMGEALDRPVVGVSTLEALARSVERGSVSRVAAVIDARRNQVYLQTFGAGSGPDVPSALDVHAALDLLSRTGGWTMVGTGAGVLENAWRTRRLAALGESAKAPFDPAAGARHDPVVNPSPRALAALTIAVDPERSPPRPLYLRAPDATPPTRLPGQPRPASPRAC